MQLPSFSERNNIGIDSAERAVAWSALLLRYGYKRLTNRIWSDSFKIQWELRRTSTGFSPEVSVSAFLYLEETAGLTGGDVSTSLIELYTGSASYTGITLTPSQQILAPLAPDIPEIDTLEKYFHINLLALIDNQLDVLYREVKPYPNLKGSEENDRIKVEAVFGYDPHTYNQTRNILEAIGVPYVPPVLPNPNPQSDFTVGNNNIFGNNFTVGQAP